MKPKYTDNRYPHGYRVAVDTDIRKTFDRVRREQAERAKKDAEIKAEKEIKVEHLPKRRTA